MSRQQEIYTHLADFANESTSIGHDINNALSILMGYTENLSMRIDTGKLEEEGLKKIVDKLNGGIDRLQVISKSLTHARTDARLEPTTVDLSVYCHRWFKVLMPCFKNWNLSFTFLDEAGAKKYNVMKWEINNFLSDFMGQWMQNFNADGITSVEVRFKGEADHIGFVFSCQHDLPEAPTVQYRDQDIVPQKNDAGIEIQIPCQAIS